MSCTQRHHRRGRGAGSAPRAGSPTCRLHGVHAATRYRVSSPVVALPRVWCAQVASPTHTPATPSWHRHPSRSSTDSRTRRHRRVDPPAQLSDTATTPAQPAMRAVPDPTHCTARLATLVRRQPAPAHHWTPAHTPRTTAAVATSNATATMRTRSVMLTAQSGTIAPSRCACTSQPSLAAPAGRASCRPTGG